MELHNRLETEVSRAQELRAALVEESKRIERNLVEYRQRISMLRPDDDDAEFAAQAAYRARREERAGKE